MLPFHKAVEKGLPVPSGLMRTLCFTIQSARQAVYYTSSQGSFHQSYSNPRTACILHCAYHALLSLFFSFAWQLSIRSECGDVFLWETVLVPSASSLSLLQAGLPCILCCSGLLALDILTGHDILEGKGLSHSPLISQSLIEVSYMLGNNYLWNKKVFITY